MPKKIEFSSKHFLIHPMNKDIHPCPASQNIPEWYKKMKPYYDDKEAVSEINSMTAKKCIPFLDAFSMGYIIKAHHDLIIKFDKEKGIGIATSPAAQGQHKCPMNTGEKDNFHHPNQLYGSPFNKETRNASIIKFKNPWVIKTEPGTSCIFTKPFNHHEKRFTPFTGIVDTDTYHNLINFPLTVHNEGEFVITKGTPIVQIIPFTRESWKMKLTKMNEQKLDAILFKFSSYLKESYKKVWWGKKSYK